RYQLVAPAGSTGAVTLTARLIGFKTQSVQVSLTGSDVTQDIALEEGAIELESKVVTALGIEREQRSLSYAAQTIGGDRLSDVRSNNVVSSLQGKVAGVQVTNSANPFGSARIVVRGASSILGQNQPLIFVDGNGGGTNDFADESWGPKLDGRTTGCVRVKADSITVIGQPAVYDNTHPCNQFFGAGPWMAHPNNVRDFWQTGLMVNANVAV